MPINAVSVAGQEIAYAEYTAGTLAVPGSETAIPSLQITIPAGTGPYWVEFGGTYQATATATNGVAIVFAVIRDEGNLVLDVARLRGQIPASAQLWEMRGVAKKRMAPTSTAKTITVTHLATLSSATANLLSGTGTVNSLTNPGPVFLTAYGR